MTGPLVQPTDRDAADASFKFLFDKLTIGLQLSSTAGTRWGRSPARDRPAEQPHMVSGEKL